MNNQVSQNTIFDPTVNNCGAFDSGLTIHPDGKVSPCCLFDHRYFKNFHEIDWNNNPDPWHDLRDGRGCSACNHSGPTYKDTFWDYFNNKFSIRFLDIRNNNLCNLECVTCNSYYSSKWADRLEKKEKFVSTPLSTIDLKSVRRIYFAGGEPLLNKMHWDVLNSIENPEHVGLLYSSNLTYVEGVEQQWKRFNSVRINASIDGIGDFGEQIRTGLKWKRWVENVKRISQVENVEIFINPTISLLNIWHLKDIEDWAQTYNFTVNYNILTEPRYYCVNALPDELKKSIEYVPDNEHLKDLLSEDRSYYFKETIAMILLNDRLKSTNLWEYVPFKKWAIKNMLDY